MAYAENGYLPYVSVFVFFPIYLVNLYLLNISPKKEKQKEKHFQATKVIFSSFQPLYQECKWKDLEIGDIVLIRNNQIFPGNVLLLDSENEYCLCDTSAIDRRTTFLKKFPLKLTSVPKNSPLKGKMNEYKKILNGQINYSLSFQENNFMNSIKATIKLKNDPIAEEASSDNFASKGMKLMYSDWILGLILSFENENEDFYKRNLFFNAFHYRLINSFNFLIIIMVIFECFLGLIQIRSNHSYPINISEIENPVKDLMVLLVVSIPANISILLQTISLLYKIMLEKKYKKQNLQVLSPNRLPCLDHISHLLIESNDIIDTNKNSKIKYIYLSNSKNFYELKKKKSPFDNQNYKGNKEIKNINENTINEIKISVADNSALIWPSDNFRISEFPNEIHYKFTQNLNEQNDENHEIEKNHDLKEFKNLQNIEIQKKSLDLSPLDPLTHNAFTENDFRQNNKFNILPFPANQTIDSEILKGLLLCNDIRTKEQNFQSDLGVNSKFVNEYALPDTEEILKYIAQYNYKLISHCLVLDKYLPCYKALINNLFEDFFILSKYTEFSQDNKYYKFSIIVKENLKPVNFFIRTNNISILDSIDNIEEHENDKIKKEINFLTSIGMRIVIILKNVNCVPEEIETYLKSVKNPESEEFKNAERKIQSCCELLTILAIKDHIKEGIKLLFNDFLKIHNKIWLISSDYEEKVFSMAALTNLTNNEIMNIKLQISPRAKDSNIDEAWMKIRGAFDKLKKILVDENTNNEEKSPISRKNTAMKMASSYSSPYNNFFKNKKSRSNQWKYNLIVNGEFLRIVKQNEDLLNHFAFLTHFSQSFICFELDYQDKSFLFEIIKRFPSNPVTLSIGGGYENKALLKNADVSIEIQRNNAEQNKFVGAGDLLINNDDDFKIIRDVIRVETLLYNEKIKNIILLCYSNSLLSCFPLFLYSLFYGVITNELIPRAFFIVKDTVILNVLSIGVFLWGNSYYNPYIIKAFAWNYKEGQLQNEFFLKIFLLQVFLIPFIHSILIVLFMSLGNSILILGNFSLYEEFKLGIYSLIIIMITQFAIHFDKKPLMFIGISFGFGFLAFFFLIIIYQNEKDFAHLGLLDLVNYLLKESEAILLVIFFTFYKLFLCYPIDKFIELIFTGSYQRVKMLIAQGTKYNLINNLDFQKNIKKKYNDHFCYENVKESIKYFFGNKNMDFSIQNMIGIQELQVKEWNFNNFTLNFKEKVLQGKFESYIKRVYLEKKVKISIFAMFPNIMSCIASIFLINNESHLEIDIKLQRMSLILAGYIIFLIFNILMLKVIGSKKYIVARLTLPLVNFITSIILFSSSFENDHRVFSIIFIFSSLLLVFAEAEYFDSFAFYTIQQFISYILIIICTLVNKIDFIITFNDIPQNTSPDISNIASFLIMIISIIGSEIYSKYSKEKFYRVIFINEQCIQQQNKKIDELLSILFPNFVKDFFIDGKYILSEDECPVSVLFCDICNFDEIVKSEKGKVVHLIDKLYRKFDIFCNESHVKKIETVGKTYLACAGLKRVESGCPVHHYNTSVQRTIDLAIKIMKYAQNFTWKESKYLVLKIGINFGPVIAGVIGYHKPQFSLIGDTVNTASRVCSTGEENHITISESAYLNIKGKYKGFEFIEKIAVAKGKGEIITYQIIQKDNTMKQMKKSQFHEINYINLFSQEKSKSKELNEIKLLTSQNKKELDSESLFGVNSLISREKYADSNILAYLESDHFKKAYLQNNGKFNGFLEKKENYPGEFLNMSESKANIENFQLFNEDFLDQMKFEIHENDLLKYNKIWLYFQQNNDKNILKEFFDESLGKLRKNNIYRLAKFYFFYLANTFLLFSSQTIPNFYIIMIFRAIINITNIVEWYLIKKDYKFLRLFMIIHTFLIINELMSEFLISSWLSLKNIIEVIFFFSNQSKIIQFTFIDIIILGIYITIYLIVYLVIVPIQDLFIIICFVIFSMVFILYNQYINISNIYRDFNTNKLNLIKKTQQNNLIVNLLPSHILDKFLGNPNEKHNFIEEFDQVTLLFADIAGFTKFSSSVRPEKVVALLRELFTEFDKACLDNSVYKLYTIGDCYVVLGVIDAAERDINNEALNVVKMGFQMLEKIQFVKEKSGLQEINMRIGIHTGHIYGGIIGTDIIRYDIYGKDVSIANKMESNGIEGQIVMSNKTKDIIEKNFPSLFSFEEHKDIVLFDEKINIYRIDKLKKDE